MKNESPFKSFDDFEKSMDNSVERLKKINKDQPKAKFITLTKKDFDTVTSLRIDLKKEKYKAQKKAKNKLWMILERTKLLWEIGGIVLLILTAIKNNEWIWSKLIAIWKWIPE